MRTSSGRSLSFLLLDTLRQVAMPTASRMRALTRAIPSASCLSCLSCYGGKRPWHARLIWPLGEHSCRACVAAPGRTLSTFRAWSSANGAHSS